MATYSTEVTVGWNTSSFSEVSAVSHSYGGVRVGRSAKVFGVAGAATIETLSPTLVSNALCGTTGTLSITGGGVSLTCDAIYETCGAAPVLNGVTRYTVNFKLLG